MYKTTIILVHTKADVTVHLEYSDRVPTDDDIRESLEDVGLDPRFWIKYQTNGFPSSTSDAKAKRDFCTVYKMHPMA